MDWGLLMKQFVGLFAVSLVIFLLMPMVASADLGADARRLMLKKGKSMTAEMVECANLDAYVKSFLDGSSYEEGAERIVSDIKKADWSECHSGTVYVIRDEAVISMLKTIGALNQEISPRMRAKAISELVEGFHGTIAMETGAEFMTAATMLSVKDAFVSDCVFPANAFVYLRYSEFDVLCRFQQFDGGVITAKLFPVPAGSEEILKQHLKIKGFLGFMMSLSDEYPLEG